jgi:hypothetical protein
LATGFAARRYEIGRHRQARDWYRDQQDVNWAETAMTQIFIRRARVSVSRASRPGMVEIWRRLRQGIFDPYRPELHYMRGPGPKWREIHAQDRHAMTGT